MTAADFASFSNSAVTFAGAVYALAFLAHVAEWAMARSVPAAAFANLPVTVGAPSEPTVGVEDRQVEPDLEEKALGVDRFGRIGIALTGLAGLLHLAGLVARGLAADPIRVPWGNMYEFTLAGAMGVTLIYLLLLRRYHLRWLGLLVTGFNLVVLMLAGLVLYVPAGPLVPALQSYWLVVHVVAAVIATGAFTVGGMASLLFLLKQRAEMSAEPRSTGYIARLPASSVMDRVAYRVHAFGFPVWTFAALVAGPIWAEYAWGRYWGWDPKEVWAFITWVVYAGYLHARATAGWKGKAAAVIALIGFGTLVFNFVGINLFGSGLHSYSGLD